MDNLKYLYLNSNKIQKIKNETFNNLKNLEELLLMKMK
jgi:Leucine-rich repeat (LRR) protein